MRIDCKSIAQKWKQECLDARLTYNANATLAILQVGDNPASNSYIKGKLKDCEEVGYVGILYKFEETVSEWYLLDIINDLNYDETIDGIIVQLPLPKHLNQEKITSAVASEKDVDGFLKDSKFTPCTPLGVMNLLNELNVELKDKFVVVLGRSEFIGKKVANMCLEKNATVCICHSKTPLDIRNQLLKQADVVISAVGKPQLFSWENVKENSIVIDIGINKVDGKLCGDFIPPKDENYCNFTTVPGGVGLLTRATLMKNLCKTNLEKNSKNKKKYNDINKEE